MKLLLVSSSYAPAPNLGLAYLSTAVKKTRHSCSLADIALCRNKKKSLTEAVRKEKPDVIGFSGTIFDFETVRKLAGQIRSQFKDISIIIGGPGAMVNPGKLICRDEFDAVCISEGDSVIGSFLDNAEEGKTDSPGIWYNLKNRRIKNPPPRPVDPDRTGFPDWSMWNLKKYFRRYFMPGAMSVISSRGCSRNCPFCSNSAIKERLNTGYRKRSVKGVLDEIEFLIERYHETGLKGIMFRDEMFAFDRDWFFRFTEGFMKRGFSRLLYWGCDTSTDLIDREWADAAASSGCIFVNTGVECGNEIYRKNFYGKHISNSDYKKAGKILSSFRILNNGNFIAGAPGEKIRDIYQTLRFRHGAGFNFSAYNRFVPIANSPVGNKLRASRRVVDTARGPFMEDCMARSHSEIVLFLMRMTESLRLAAGGCITYGCDFLIRTAAGFSRTGLRGLLKMYGISSILRRAYVEALRKRKKREISGL